MKVIKPAHAFLLEMLPHSPPWWCGPLAPPQRRLQLLERAVVVRNEVIARLEAEEHVRGRDQHARGILVRHESSDFAQGGFDLRDLEEGWIPFDRRVDVLARRGREQMTQPIRDGGDVARVLKENARPSAREQGDVRRIAVARRGTQRDHLRRFDQRFLEEQMARAGPGDA